jgi:excisionase family DNA binding protein
MSATKAQRKLRTKHQLPPHPESMLLTVEEFAAEIRVPPQSVRDRIWKGEIASVKIGGLRRIERAELARFIAEGPLQPGAA